MENSTANTDERQMHDIAMAQSYVRDIGGRGTPVKVMIPLAHALLSRLFPHKSDPKKQWTERRVRGFISGDAATVQFREMLELHKAAEVAKAERKLIEEARKEHAAFIEKTASLRSLLERQDEAFHGPQIEGLGSQLGGVDSTRTEG